MAGEVEELKAILRNIDDLQRYVEQEDLLGFAVTQATDRINLRRGYSGAGYEPQFRSNVIRGAIDYLTRLGGEEYQSFGENGVSASYREEESWLSSVVPLLRTYP